MAVKSTGNTAVDADEYETWDRTGKKVRPRRKAPKPDPDLPMKKGVITFDKIDMKKLEAFDSGTRRVIKANGGIRYIGFDVAFIQDGKKKSGWMPEADYNRVRRLLFRQGTMNVDGLEY